MKELVEYLVRELVAHPDSVHVTETRAGGSVTYEVRVHPEDVGKVIGRGGRVANSLRTLVKAAASRSSERASVEIMTD
ncbi:MAG: KH domain-containing protein [Armatimonadota bacterium]|nr:KH domain-containing protein [Armatimonadota bacterium]